MGYIDASSFVLTLPNAVGSITGSSTPFSIGEVASLIVRVSAELDGAAAEGGYAVPLPTGATLAYAEMELLTVRGAAGFMLSVIFPGGTAGGMKLADEYTAAYQEALKMLRSGMYVLVGASSSAGGEARELPQSFSTENPLATSGVTPQMGMDFRP